MTCKERTAQSLTLVQSWVAFARFPDQAHPGRRPGLSSSTASASCEKGKHTPARHANSRKFPHRALLRPRQDGLRKFAVYIRQLPATSWGSKPLFSTFATPKTRRA